MKDYHTTNSHYLTYTFLFKWLGECIFWTWKWKAFAPITWGPSGLGWKCFALAVRTSSMLPIMIHSLWSSCMAHLMTHSPHGRIFGHSCSNHRHTFSGASFLTWDCERGGMHHLDNAAPWPSLPLSFERGGNTCLTSRPVVSLSRLLCE